VALERHTLIGLLLHRAPAKEYIMNRARAHACVHEWKCMHTSAPLESFLRVRPWAQVSLIDVEMDGSTNRGSADCDLVLFILHVLDLLQMERGVCYQHLVHQL